MDTFRIDEIARRLLERVPPALRSMQADLETNFRAVLRERLSKLDLVSRDEFDAQTRVLERTRAQLEALEARLAVLESGAPARTIKLLARLQQLLGEINDAHLVVATLPSLTRSRELIQRAQRWADKLARRNLAKVQTRLDRLTRRGSGV